MNLKIGDGSGSGLDCLLIFVPKFRNYYKPIGEHMFTVLLPMGLMSIADLVHNKGYKTQILHLGLEKISNPRFSLKQYLAETNPKVIGLSLHWHYQCHDTIETARSIKQYNPDIFVVLGGLTASYFHEEILKEFDFIDAVVRGDGEIPFLELLKDVYTEDRDFSKIPNLTWRDEGTVRANDITYVAQQEDLDDFNFANFNLLKNYRLYIKMQDLRGGRWSRGVIKKLFSKFGSPAYFPLLTHKGCIFNCSYCGGSRTSQKIACGRDNVSFRSVGKVIKTIQEAKRYGYKEIYLSYLPSPSHPGYFEGLFEAIKNADTDMDYFLECWMLPSRELIRSFSKIAASGNKLYIGLSPETGSESVRRLNKGCFYTNEELLDRLELIKSFKIKLVLYFSLGLPRETMEDIRVTLDFKQMLRKRFSNIISISTINPVMEPASPMFIHPERYGIARTRNNFRGFILSSEDTNRRGFLTLKLGYFKNDFGASEEIFRCYLQKTICRSSCRLSDFISSDLLKTDDIFLKKIVSGISRTLCAFISVLRSPF